MVPSIDHIISKGSFIDDVTSSRLLPTIKVGRLMETDQQKLKKIITANTCNINTKMVEERITLCCDFRAELAWFCKQCAEKPTLEHFVDVYADAILKHIDLHDIKNKPVWNFLWGMCEYSFNYPENLILLFNEMHHRMYNEDDYCDYLSLVLTIELVNQKKMPYDEKYLNDNIIHIIKKMNNLSITMYLISTHEKRFEIIPELATDKTIIIVVLLRDILDGDYGVFFKSSECEKNFLKTINQCGLYNYKIHHWMTKHSIDTSTFCPCDSMTFKVKNYDHDIMTDYLLKSRSKAKFIELCFMTFEEPIETINFIGLLDRIDEDGGDKPIKIHDCNKKIIQALSVIKNYFNFKVVFNAVINKLYEKNFYDEIFEQGLINNVHNLDVEALLYFSSREHIQEYIQNNDVKLKTSLDDIILVYGCFSERELILYFNKIMETLAQFNKKIYISDMYLIDCLHMTALNRIINHDVVVRVTEEDQPKTKICCHINDKKKYFNSDILVFYDDMFFIDSITIHGNNFILENKISVRDYITPGSHEDP